MKEYFLLLFLLPLLFYNCEAQDGNEKFPSSNSSPLDTQSKLDSLVLEIATHNKVEKAFIGKAALPSKQWKRYEQLKKIATMDQMVALTKHENPAVRCYAFQSLANKKSDQVFPILLSHLQDTAFVFARNGCFTGNVHVRDYFIAVVLPKHMEFMQLDAYNLSKKERKIVDSLLTQLK